MLLGQNSYINSHVEEMFNHEHGLSNTLCYDLLVDQACLLVANCFLVMTGRQKVVLTRYYCRIVPVRLEVSVSRLNLPGPSIQLLHPGSGRPKRSGRKETRPISI